MSKKSDPTYVPISPALERTPPQALEAEQAVLASIMVFGNEVIDDVRAVLVPADFYSHPNQRIFEAMLSLAGRGEASDLILVADELERLGTLDAAGGRAYLSAIHSGEWSRSRLPAYLERVEDAAILRRMIDVGGQIIGMAYDREHSVAQVTEDACRLLDAVAERKRGRTDQPKPLSELMPQAMEWIEELANGENRVPGTPTGFLNLDKMLGGFQPGDLVLVAGRPSMGKTAAGLNLLMNAAFRGHPGCMFSLEMTGKSCCTRLISMDSSVDGARLRVGDLRSDPDHGDEHPMVMRSIARLANLPLWIDDRGDRKLYEMRSIVRSLHKLHGLKIVVVDYADLMVREVPPEHTRHELGRISASLKNMAKEFQLTTILLAQLSRKTEDRKNKRPQLSDLAECGYMERDADVILFPFRPAYYDETVGDTPRPVENAEIIIGKHRNGPTGTVPVLFFPNLASFVDRGDDGTRADGMVPDVTDG